MRYPFLTTEVIPEYVEMRIKVTGLFDAVVGKEKGDPVKGMATLVDVVRGEGVFEGREWPLWLVLGEDAEADFRERARRTVESLDKNKDISYISNFD